MATKAERRAARERVSAYHHAQLAELLSHVGAAIDRYRDGDIDAHAMDETIHHYHRAAAELWKFCFARGGGTHAEFIASLLDRMTTSGKDHRLVGTRHTATTPVITTVRRSHYGCRGRYGPWPPLTTVERAKPPIGAGPGDVRGCW